MFGEKGLHTSSQEDQTRSKYGGGSIMVRRGCSAFGSGILQVIEGNVSGATYKDLLD